MENAELIHTTSDDNLSYVVTVITPYADNDGADVTAMPYWERSRSEQVADITATVAEHCSKHGRGNVTVTVTEIAC